MPLFIKLELNRQGMIDAFVTDQRTGTGDPAFWSAVRVTESTVSQAMRSLAAIFAANRYVAPKENGKR